MNISLQAHTAAKMASPNETISAAIFDTRTLLFTHGGYKDIKLDLIKYSVTRPKRPENHGYIGKGMQPGCVHYLIRVDDGGMYFFLGKHVCNITI